NTGRTQHFTLSLHDALPICPLPEVAGDAGLFHDVSDEEGFAADILRLNDPAERAVWSQKSLRNTERFSTERMISRYIDIYRSLRSEEHTSELQSLRHLVCRL